MEIKQRNLYSKSNLLILNDLILKQTKMTAYSMSKYKTTRLSNHIHQLRKYGIGIKTIINNTDNKKWFGSYELIQDKQNIRLATNLRDTIKQKHKSKIR